MEFYCRRHGIQFRRHRTSSLQTLQCVGSRILGKETWEMYDSLQYDQFCKSALHLRSSRGCTLCMIRLFLQNHHSRHELFGVIFEFLLVVTQSIPLLLELSSQVFGPVYSFPQAPIFDITDHSRSQWISPCLKMTDQDIDSWTRRSAQFVKSEPHAILINMELRYKYRPC